tara:strand:+ start:293 stop:787 length:495 start_codon:yes stop_codon:yes gene_type:complete
MNKTLILSMFCLSSIFLSSSNSYEWSNQYDAHLICQKWKTGIFTDRNKEIIERDIPIGLVEIKKNIEKLNGVKQIYKNACTLDSKMDNDCMTVELDKDNIITGRLNLYTEKFTPYYRLNRKSLSGSIVGIGKGAECKKVSLKSFQKIVEKKINNFKKSLEENQL